MTDPMPRPRHDEDSPPLGDAAPRHRPSEPRPPAPRRPGRLTIASIVVMTVILFGGLAVAVSYSPEPQGQTVPVPSPQLPPGAAETP